MWVDLPTTTDPELSSLAKQLPQFCLNSKSANTKRKYSCAFNNFCKWCNNFTDLNVKPLPASNYYVSLYLVHLSKTSYAKVEEAFYAISLEHKLAGYSDSCCLICVVQLRKASTRWWGMQ